MVALGVIAGKGGGPRVHRLPLRRGIDIGAPRHMHELWVALAVEGHSTGEAARSSREAGTVGRLWASGMRLIAVMRLFTLSIPLLMIDVIEAAPGRRCPVRSYAGYRARA